MSREQVSHATIEERLRANHGQVDPFLLSERQHGLRPGDVDGEAAGNGFGARISRRHNYLGDIGIPAEAPRQCVLPPAVSEHQHFHGHDCIRNAEGTRQAWPGARVTLPSSPTGRKAVGGVSRWKRRCRPVAEVKIQEGESIESALRRFKRKVQQEDIIKDIKKHSFYLKPGDKRRAKQALARKRSRKKQRRESD